jgi:hypothetical protein
MKPRWGKGPEESTENLAFYKLHKLERSSFLDMIHNNIYSAKKKNKYKAL